MADDFSTKIVLPAVTFVLGFLVKTFIPTSKERFDIRSVKRENATKQKNELDKRYQDFHKSLVSLIGADHTTLPGQKKTLFWELRKHGDLYFGQLDTVASYIKDKNFEEETSHYDFFSEL